MQPPLQVLNHFTPLGDSCNPHFREHTPPLAFLLAPSVNAVPSPLSLTQYQRKNPHP